jgi:hypothetical protein
VKINERVRNAGVRYGAAEVIALVSGGDRLYASSRVCGLERVRVEKIHGEVLSRTLCYQSHN